MLKKLAIYTSLSLLTVLAWTGIGGAEVALFGLTPSAGAIGDGRLTAQVSGEGTITCLRWPNATFYEHVKYKAGLWNDDPAQNDYLKPHYGAGAGDGFFGGVRFTTADGFTMRWLRDGARSFSYANESSNRLVTRYAFPDGLLIEEETFNVPDKPFLVRLYRAVAIPTGADDLHIIAYANPALRKEHGAYSPTGDYENDGKARYATFALPQRQAVLTALPSESNSISEVETLVAAGGEADVAAFVDDHLVRWGTGIYLAQGVSSTLAGFQVGGDASISGTVPTDAFIDAQDGVLARNNAAAKFETTALLFPIPKNGVAAWYAAFGTTAAKALGALELAQGSNPETHAKESDAWWSAKLANAVLPTEPKARKFSLRALISLRTGTDPESGAVVASTSCQPPYNVDWPRDGAFFQFVLNLNGFEEEADRHARFYQHIQYTEKGTGLLARDKVGRFPMNAFADYVPGGPIDWEIDNTGFALWLYRVHAGSLSQKSPAAAHRFLKEIAPSMILAADLLTDCKDETNDLQCFANEDDNPEFTQSFHGALTTWLGLKSADEMATALGDTARAARYQRRGNELAAAIRRHYDPSLNTAIHPQQLAWSYWPAGFWAPHEEATHQFAVEGMLRRFSEGPESLFDPASRGSQYSQKSSIALQLPPLRSATTLGATQKVHAFFLDQMVRQDTLHLGEFTQFNDLDGDGTKEYVNVVATPHIWAQVLLYLSLIADEYPEALEVPPLRVEKSPGLDTGCACRSGGTAGLPTALLLFVLFVGLRRLAGSLSGGR